MILHQYEIKNALKEGKVKRVYPQIVPKLPNQTKYYNEYRFFCEKCKNEWTCTTKPGSSKPEPVPGDSEYVYSEEDKILVPR